jgi:hypothetical protein
MESEEEMKKGRRKWCRRRRRRRWRRGRGRKIRAKREFSLVGVRERYGQGKGAIRKRKVEAK